MPCLETPRFQMGTRVTVAYGHSQPKMTLVSLANIGSVWPVAKILSCVFLFCASLSRPVKKTMIRDPAGQTGIMSSS